MTPIDFGNYRLTKDDEPGNRNRPYYRLYQTNRDEFGNTYYNQVWSGRFEAGGSNITATMADAFWQSRETV